MSRKGIDISCWQKNVDYAKVKASGIEFVMIRTGYGRNANQKDGMVETHVRGCEAAGLDYGFYHYSYADTVEKAKQEAAFCLSIIKGLNAKPTYPIAFDFEDAIQSKLTTTQKVEIIKAFCEVLDSAGYYVSVYSFVSWMNVLASGLDKYDKWVAHFSSICGYKGSDMGMWQYTSSGKVDGISGNVDMDIAYLDYPAIIKSRGLNGFEKPVEKPDKVKPDAAEEMQDVVYPTANTIAQAKVSDSKLIVGNEKIPTIIINDIMYAPVRETVRVVGSRQMGVEWNDAGYYANVTLEKAEQDAE